MSVKVIAIDGPAASGKSTVARLLAARVGALYVGTGMMYRALAWKARRLGLGLGKDDSTAEGTARFTEGIKSLLPGTELHFVFSGGEVPSSAAVSPSGADERGAKEKDPARILIDGMAPSAEELSSDEISALSSRIAVIPEVRSFMTARQRAMAENSWIVMEGRDIGTEVFPDAPVKFFLTASSRVRALRRLLQNGKSPSEDAIRTMAEAIEARDRTDETRAVAPLRKAEDAILVDNSSWSVEQTVDRMAECFRESESAMQR